MYTLARLESVCKLISVTIYDYNEGDALSLRTILSYSELLLPHLDPFRPQNRQRKVRHNQRINQNQVKTVNHKAKCAPEIVR